MALHKHSPVKLFDQTGGFSTGSNQLPAAGIELVTTKGMFEIQWDKGTETQLACSLEALSGDGVTWVPVLLNSGALLVVGGDQTSSTDGLYPLDFTGSEQLECPLKKVRFDAVITGTPDGATRVAIYWHGAVQS